MVAAGRYSSHEARPLRSCLPSLSLDTDAVTGVLAGTADFADLDLRLSDLTLVQAYSPLCKGSGRMLSQPQLTKVAKEAGVSTAQVMLRWSIQKGFVPLPKTTDETRMQQNFDIYSFELSPKQMATLDALERNFITAWDPSEDVPV